MRLHLMPLLALSCLMVACGDKDDSGDTGSTADSGAVASGDFGFCSRIVENFCYLSGEHTEDLTLTASYHYVLEGGVFIGDDTSTNTMYIEPGVTIYGDTATKGFLTIRRNASIEAIGTAEAPIVFTSPIAIGSRARSDWGGIILNGNAEINNCYDGAEQLPCEAEGEGGTGTYGGSDNSDSSGTLQYVRVEFGGIEISTENEVNGIAFQGVGSGTTVDYVQVHFNKDDGVEFFGGAVQVSHLVLSGIGDDSLDYTDGWVGGATDVYVQHIDGYESDRGMEMDNNGDANDATPTSDPTISNVLISGSSDGDTGFLAREGTKGTYSNINITGAKNCFDIDGDQTWANIQAGELTVTGSTFDCENTVKNDDGDEDPKDGQPDESFNADIEGWLLEDNSEGSVDGSAPSWATGWTESASN